MTNLLQKLFVKETPPIQEKPQLTNAGVIELSRIYDKMTTSRVYDLVDTLISGYNPNEFMQKAAWNTIDKMLVDEHIFGILEMKKLFLLSTGWEIVSTDEQTEIKQFLTENFTSKYKRNFQNDLKNILNAYEYGFSAQEKIYDRIDGKIYCTGLKVIPPHSLEFITDKYGNTEQILQENTELGMIDSLPAWKILLFNFDKRWDSPYGRTCLERCFKFYKAKELVIKAWNIYLMRFAGGVAVGKTPNGGNSAEADKLRKLLDSFQQGSSIVTPKDAEVEILSLTSSSGEYDRAIERYNQAIARTLMVPDLLGFGATTQGGSFSLGQKQVEIFMSIIRQDRQYVECAINNEVIKPLIILNYGEQESYPQFKFIEFKDDNLDKFLTQFMTAVNSGKMPITDQDWNEFRAKVGFSKLSDDELAAINEEKESKKQENITTEPIQMAESKYNRSLSKYEKRSNFIEQDKKIVSDAESVASRLSDIFKLQREDIKAQIKKKKIIENNDVRAIETVTPKYFGDVKRILNQSYNDIYDNGLINGRKEIKEIKKEFRYKANVNDTQVRPEEAIKAAKELLYGQAFQDTGKWKNKINDEIKQILISGLEKGKSYEEIAMQIDELYGPITEGKQVAGAPSNPYASETVVRTNYTTFYSLGRVHAAREDEAVQMLEFSAVLDDRTTERCESLDGKLIKVDDPILESIRPALHYNCRSQLLYVMDVDVEQDNLEPSDLPSVDELADMPGGEFL